VESVKREEKILKLIIEQESSLFFPLVLGGGNQPPNDVKRREKEIAFEYLGKETIFESSQADGGPSQRKRIRSKK
jgi:hypothetical protein